ncbi:MAG TPA: ATP-binding protein [Polyangia bacterium]|jgi:SpoVK/Ycf46/Vps4 family AAA+-type ATPase|nr:ATP-binding protein [Polyangia bacterium]
MPAVPTEVDLLSSLLHALGQRRWEDAVRLGEEIADREARRGHARVARKLRGALASRDGAEVAEAFSPTPVGTHLAGALLPVDPVDGLDDVVLPSPLRAQLAEVLQEWRHRGKLDAAGVTRRTKLLFHGPPGCGKTITARALGGAMSLPVMVVRFDGVVGSYLGQTAARLRELFRYAEAVPSVLVLDEIDALAQRRGNPRDVGELDRVVVSLLQELEHSMPQGIVVASSNLPRALDDALWRRFDLVLDFPVPSAAQILAFARKRQIALGGRPGRDLAGSLRRARSYADAERVVTDMHRREILSREME